MSYPHSIFLIDDDVDDAEFFKEALQRIDPDIRFYSAVNGKTAHLQLAGLRESLPGFIFLDLNMPKTNGKDFLKELRKDATYENIKVIIYSTSINQRDMTETLELGAHDFLIIPTSLDELVSGLKELLM
jgi:DNA-binding response OmpR family regulator